MVTRRGVIASGLAFAAAGAVGYALWPRLDGYREEVARQRQLLAGDPTLRDLVRMASLAANGHNTQPWKFRLEEGRISILPDLTRRTEVVDPDDHHLYASLGCAAENLIIAARSQGWGADAEITEGPAPEIAVTLDEGTAGDETLYAAIPLRQSTRSVYDGQAISADDMALLKQAAAQDGVAVRIFTEPAARAAIIEFVVAGNSAQMDDPAFVKELRDWLRFSPEAAMAKGDGLFGACSGHPVMPDWIGRPMFDAMFTKEAENAKYIEHIRSSAGVAVFVGDRADPQHWIRVGRSFERFALQATLLGIRTAHINQPIEVPSLRDEFAGWLGMPDQRPDLVVRFGRAEALPMSLRRPVDAVIV